MRREGAPSVRGPPHGVPRAISVPWLWPRFPDATLEHAFRASRDERSILEVRLVFMAVVLAGLVALALTAVTSQRVAERPGEEVLLLALALSALAASYLPPLQRRPQQLGAAWCILAAMVLLGVASGSASADEILRAPIELVVLGGIVLGAGSLLVPRALLVCGLILIASVLATLAAARPVAIAPALAAVSLLALVGSWWREHQLRRAFLLRHELEQERTLSDTLLFNVMPERIARRIRAGEFPIADNLGEATVLFLDLVGFTAFAARTEPAALVGFLDELWTRLDDIVEEQGLEKLKTIGDAYMAVVGGAQNPRLDAEMAAGAVSAGLRMIAELRRLASRHGYPLDARVGIHTGPVVAGVIGRYRYQFDVWGDTVNVASRLEEGGVAGRVHLSSETYRRVRHRFEVERHGTVDVEGKGRMETFWVLRTKAPSLHG